MPARAAGAVLIVGGAAALLCVGPARILGMRELQFIRSGRLAWSDRAAPVLREPRDAIVRPFIAARCDGDTVPIHRPVSRVMQAGLAARVIDPAGSPGRSARTRRALGARSRRRAATIRYDVVVEASSRAAGLRRAIRSLTPGGICTAVGYYLATGTRVPLMHMYATDATLRVGVSHARAVLPDLLAFIARRGFPAEDVTTLTADWDDAPTAYAARTTKVVIQRDVVSAG